MAAQSTKGLLDRIRDKVGDKVADWLFEGLKWLVGSVLLGGWAVLARHWIAGEWACISKPSCEVSGWSLGALIAVTIMTTGAAIVLGWLWYRTRRKLRAMEAKPKTPQFRDIQVEDERLNLRWFIRRRPNDWLQWRNVADTIPAQDVHTVLDGPFHADCMAALVEIPARQTSSGFSGSPTFDENCRTCGQRIFIGSRHHEGYAVSVWRVRAYALEELQRMQRKGTKIPEAQWSPPIALENPEYWKVMLPPTQ